MERNVRKIIYGQAVREKISKGVAKTARAVGTTLGSKGRNVSIPRNFGPPVIMHDGVTVARNIILEDPFEDQAAQLVISAAQNTNNEAGDGTTTATILTDAIVQEALPIISAGTNPMIIRKGIDKTIPKIIEELRRLARPVKKIEEMKQVATISAADPDLGDLIATAIQKVGEEGLVTVQEGSGSTIEVEYKEGMDLPRGYISPYLVTNTDRMEIVYEASQKRDTLSYPYVIVINQKVNNQILAPVVDVILRSDQQAQFLIIADEFETDALQSLIVSKIRMNIMCAGIKAPDFGQHRTNILTDIAVVTGGKVIGGTVGIPVEQVKLTDIGQCEKIVVTPDQTLIIGGRGQKKDIEDQITGIKKLLRETTDLGIRDRLEGRLAKLIGGVAVISVGAPSEPEMREKKERIYDAVNATKAAVSEGIVPGGGVSLIKVSRVIPDLKLTEEEKIGARIVQKALTYPAKKLIENAGVDNAGFAIGKIMEHDNPNWGFNVDTEQYEDLMKSGVIDPVKVTRSALLNASSVASILITTECMIADKPQTEKKKETEEEGIGTF